MGLRVNIGCGLTPTPGWINLDNSPSVWLANRRLLGRLLVRLPLLPAEQRRFIGQSITRQVRFASAIKLPFPDGSAEVIYSSHMLEHLHRAEAALFLCEARRVLAPNGVLRLALPDLRLLAVAYLDSGDADAFVEATFLAPDHVWSGKYRLLAMLWGARHHQWMYDGSSLLKILTGHGFRNPRILPPGTTTITDPGELDLVERQAESVYVEAVR